MNVTLRAVEPSDANILFIWENDRRGCVTGGADAPLSHRQLWEYANNYDANPFSSGQLRLIMEVDGRAAGCIDLYDISGCHGHAMTGIYVAPEFRRKGVAKEALRQLLEFSFYQLSLRTIAADVAADNDASRRLFEHSGFIQSGIKHEWFRRGEHLIDSIFYQCQQIGHDKG